MADIFNTNVQIGGVWKIDGAVLSIEGGQDLVATDLRLNYARTVTDYQPINQNGRFLIAGPGAGDVTIGAIIGPSKGIKDFITRFADICQAPGNTIVIKPSGVTTCDGQVNEGPVEFIAGGCSLMSMGLSVTNMGNLALVSSSFTLKITSLQLK